jgi:putative membrane-bound dehydrogenase-like protein
MRPKLFSLTTRSLTLAAICSGSICAMAENHIVFLAGGRSHGPGEHEFFAGCSLLAKALGEQSGLGIRASVVKGWPKDESILDTAKAVVIYADGTSVVSKGWEKMDALAKKGTGIVFMHYAVHPSAAAGEKYYRPWIGGAFETGYSVNPHWVADLKGLPKHPVSNGVPSAVEALDEFYYNIRFPEDRSKVLDLVTATPTRERMKKYINLWNEHGVNGLGKKQTIMWGIERADGGRGVGFTGGHYHRNWAVDGFRTLALNAIVWSAKMEVPKGGVKSLPLTEDDLNANLDDKGKDKPWLKLPVKGEFAAIPAAPIQTEREAGFGKDIKTVSAVKPVEPAKPVTAAEKKAAGKPLAETKVLTSTSKPRLVGIEAKVMGQKELVLVASDDGAFSCDWANWIDPVVEMEDGKKLDLTTVKWKSATSGHGKVRVGKNNSGGDLSVEGKVYEKGIGTHANSVIVFDLPAGAVRFSAQVAIDDGGMERGGKPSDASIKFAVYGQRADAEVSTTKKEEVADGPALVPTDLFTVPEGLEVTVWATSPMLMNPTNIDFDAQGWMWVTEGVNYRGKSGRQKEGDRVVVLQDTTGAGKADKSTVFYQNPELASPLGVGVFGNKVVVSHSPDMLVFTDENGDGVFDAGKEKREVLLTGFAGRQHDHSLHSVTAGPDGLWYWNQGNTGANFTDKSGKTFYMGSPYMLGEFAGKKSDDGHVWIGGFGAKMNPDGTNVRIIGHNYRNSYEQTVTSFGEVFQSDNDDPPACRVTHVLEGGNAGFASADGKRSWSADKRPGQDTPTAEWRQEDPGTMPAGDVYGGGSPTGVAFYENGALGDKWNGLLLACEAGKNVVFGYLPKRDGAGWKLERFDFITSNKEKEFAGSDFLGGKANGELKTKFRPADVCVGPDGAIYVADWFDARVGGHGTMDGGLTGTIYRIAPKGFKPALPKIDFSTTEGQIAALKNPSPNVRFSGFEKLKAQGEKAVPAVAALTKDENPFIAARAVWLLAQMGDAGVAAVKPLLDSKNHETRLVAYRALRQAGKDVAGLVAKMADDESAVVRAEVALTLRDESAEKAIPSLLKIAKKFDGKDRTYLEAFGLGSKGKEAAVYTAIHKELGAPALQWTDAFAWLAWRLHPPAAVRDLRARALSGSLSNEQRKLALTALAFVKSREAADSMIVLANTKDFPMKDLAQWWLMNRKGNDWMHYDVDASMKQLGLYDPEKVKLVSVELPAEIPNAPKLPPVADILKIAGDAKRGEAAIAVCYACHKVGKNGVDFGPDLTTFGKQQPAEVIIGAIANPSADISHGYEGSEVKAKDGITIHGIVLSDADPLIIKSTGGQLQTVPRAKVESVKPLGKSLMFQPSQMGLTPEGIADIVAYLKSL